MDLPCANPANHGLVGRLLGAAQVKVGGPLRCFGQVIAHGLGQGPQLMAGPTGLGPARSSPRTSSPGFAPAGARWRSSTPTAIRTPSLTSPPFRSAYGLPTCTSASGCLRKINQNGAGPLPAGDPGWGAEISLDLDAVSSACPDCHILLVEAKSSNTPDLSKAENAAARTPGVVSVSNSFGGSEDSTVLAGDAHFHHPGIAITASSGDPGYGVSWPASSQYVTGVGGTTLSNAGSARGWTETAWSGAGSGCSAFEPKPAWQHDPGCAKRTVADVSADGDPSSGLGVYATYSSCGGGGLCDLLIGLGLASGLDGWAQVGGTGLSAPLIASVYALAGNTGSSVTPAIRTAMPAHCSMSPAVRTATVRRRIRAPPDPVTTVPPDSALRTAPAPSKLARTHRTRRLGAC